MISNEYAAGLFDGEGCLCIRDQKPNSLCVSTDLSLRTRDAVILQDFQNKWGGVITGRERNNPNSAHASTWSLRNINAVDKFVSDILPFLRVKDKQARVIKSFCSTGVTQHRRAGLPNAVVALRQQCFGVLRFLNRCGNDNLNSERYR